MKALLLALAICAPSLLPAQKPETTLTAPSQPAAHVSSSFTFNLNAPLQQAAPLFGPEGERVWIAGLGDQLAHRLGPHRFHGEDDLPGTLAQVTTDDPVILLAHEPDIFPKVPSRVALTFAGHTHGGQIRVPLVWRALVPSRYGSRFAYGHIVEQDRSLIVSGGLGTSIIPARFGVPPEIVHVTLGG